MGEVTVLAESKGVGPNASPVTRMRISEEEYEANKDKYVIDEREEAPCFDGLTKGQQKKVLERQAERQKKIDAE